MACRLTAGGARPRWTGYALGFALAGRWLAALPGQTAVGSADVPAEDVLALLETLAAEPPP